MGWGTWQGEELKLSPVLYRGRHSSGTDTHLTVHNHGHFCPPRLPVLFTAHVGLFPRNVLSEYGRKESIPKLVNHFTV